MLLFLRYENDIHPTYHKDAKFSCACGNSFTSGSTRPEIRVEICSKCHPFYTGKQKLVDTAGIVDRFKKRAAVSTQLAASKTVKKPRKNFSRKKLIAISKALQAFLSTTTNIGRPLKTKA